MAFQTPITIVKALRSIERNEYALPAIQRGFVWQHSKIERLFDSLMRGYPIGSFLFWKVRRDGIRDYRFYGFMLHYHERDNRRLPSLGEVTRDQIIAVLDGQQRLTALNIGLRGSYSYKLPRRWWNSPKAFPKRRLYLNVLADAEENEDGMKYDFRFLTEETASHDDTQCRHCWYPVGDVLKAEDTVDLQDFLIDRQLGNRRGPLKRLARLHKVVHTTPVISYYEEDVQDLDRVLDIFIRTNSGGTILSYSDMLMSMAVAQWRKSDAREVIHRTVDDINGIGDGFNFSQDFVLKAGLMLADLSVQFRITNFNSDNMKRLEDRWDGIAGAVHAAVELVATFGFSKDTLSAHNAVLPIAHYLYGRRDARSGFLSRHRYREDRGAIRMWLIRSLLKRGIWAGSVDTLLTALRGVIDMHGDQGFPSAALEKEMRQRGKRLTFDEEELEDLVESKNRLFTLLSLLYPSVDLKNRFHIDHVFPKSRFSPSRLRRAGVADDDIRTFRDRADKLPNRQLLEGSLNESKSDKLPKQWLDESFDPQGAMDHARRHDLGDIPAGMTGFSAFYEARRDRLLDKLRRLLGPDRDDVGAQ